MRGRFVFWLIALWLFLGEGAYVAHLDHFLSHDEVVLWHHGFGLSFWQHIATSLDILLISPLVAWIAAKFGSAWTFKKVAACSAFGFGLSAVMTFGSNAADSVKKPTAFFHDGQLTAFGEDHFFFMGWAITAILLLFVASTPTVKQAALCSLTLAAHVAVATIQPAWHLGMAEAFNPIAVSIILIGWAFIGLGFLWLKRKARRQ